MTVIDIDPKTVRCQKCDKEYAPYVCDTHSLCLRCHPQKSCPELDQPEWEPADMFWYHNY